MPKLNVAYVSPFEALAVKKGNPTYLPLLSPLFYRLDALIFTEEHARVKNRMAAYGRRFNPHGSYTSGRQLLGGLQSFQDMGKDFADTFKPYKTDEGELRDFKWLLAPAYFIKAVATIAALPFLFTAYTLYHLRSPKTFLPNMGMNIVLSTSWFIEGAATLVRSATLLFSAPLVMLIKIPLRAFISVFNSPPALEHNAGTRYLVAQGKKVIKASEECENLEESEAAIKYLHGISRRLHEKHLDAYIGGQQSLVSRYLGTKEETIKLEESFYFHTRSVLMAEDKSKDQKIKAARQYIGFFAASSHEEIIDQKRVVDKRRLLTAKIN